MVRKPTFLFDMDGTLFDYVGAINKSLARLSAPDEEVVDSFLVKDDPKYEYLWNRMDMIKKDEDW